MRLDLDLATGSGALTIGPHGARGLVNFADVLAIKTVADRAIHHLRHHRFHQPGVAKLEQFKRENPHLSNEELAQMALETVPVGDDSGWLGSGSKWFLNFLEY